MSKVIGILVILGWSFFAQAASGVFMVVKGDIKLVVGAEQPIAVKVGTKVKVGDMITSGPDSRAKIVMSDRNVINVSPNTKLKIEQYVNDGKSKNVKLSLLSGKVRNNVEQKYDNDKNKFEVKTPTAVAGVRGTQFITSYNDVNMLTEVITLHGQVEFRSVQVGGAVSDRAVVVNQGEQSRTDSNTNIPVPPEKVPSDVLKEIDRVTAVRRKDGADAPAANTPATTAPIEAKGPNQTTTPLIEGAIQKKYDKTKVNVQPNPVGP